MEEELQWRDLFNNTLSKHNHKTEFSSRIAEKDHHFIGNIPYNMRDMVLSGSYIPAILHTFSGHFDSVLRVRNASEKSTQEGPVPVDLHEFLRFGVRVAGVPEEALKFNQKAYVAYAWRDQQLHIKLEQAVPEAIDLGHESTKWKLLQEKIMTTKDLNNKTLYLLQGNIWHFYNSCTKQSQKDAIINYRPPIRAQIYGVSNGELDPPTIIGELQTVQPMIPTLESMAMTINLKNSRSIRFQKGEMVRVLYLFDGSGLSLRLAKPGELREGEEEKPGELREGDEENDMDA